jgi:hypothetical protein
MNNVKDSAVERMTTTGDRIEGPPVRRNCFHAVASSPGVLRTSEQARAWAAGDKFDFIYCAGLFDYLSGVISKTIVNLFLWRQPDGLVLVVNRKEEKAICPAQACGPWRSFFWTERMGALHG